MPNIAGRHTCAGLSHITSNLYVLINYCYQKNYTLVVPFFELAGHHNHGRASRSQLTEYYDYSELKVNDEHFKVIFALPDNKCTLYSPEIRPKWGLCRLAPFFQDTLIDKQIPTDVSITLPYNKQIIDIATIVSTKIGEKYACIHVRRGDRLRTRQQREDTSVVNIQRKIIDNNLQVVYIMTNEQVKFFDDLKENMTDRRILLYNDFVELATIADNYYLFCVERAVCENAGFRISTFKTFATDYYQDYLCETEGNQ